MQEEEKICHWKMAKEGGGEDRKRPLGAQKVNGGSVNSRCRKRISDGGCAFWGQGQNPFSDTRTKKREFLEREKLNQFFNREKENLKCLNHTLKKKKYLYFSFVA